MKKILLIVMMIFVLGSVSAQAKCDGGEPIKGANTHEYCLSSKGMTWWSAHVWCEKQGRKLVTMNEACIDWHGSTGDFCPNLKVGKERWVWTANPYGSDGAFHVNLSFGRIQNAGSRINTSHYALCY